MQNSKKIRVFSIPWHLGHQWELLKIREIDWTYCYSYCRGWSDLPRGPYPKHLKWVPYYEPGKYDLAILHIDQQCLSPKLGKSFLYYDLRKTIKDIPIIVINHGTPCYPEKYDWEEAKKKMRKAVSGAAAMVVNSKQAAKDWGFGIPIWHGLEADEWFDLPKEPRVVTFISAAGIGTKYYGRHLMTQTREILYSKYNIRHIWMADPREFTPEGRVGMTFFEEYRDYLGRSLVYFNPTYGSPMPRTRTEAMFSGCCIITTRYHDANTFIKDGINGYLIKNNPEHAAGIIANCIKNYKNTIKVGQEGKKTAHKLFSKERFQKEWLDLIHKVLNEKRIL